MAAFVSAAVFRACSRCGNLATAFAAPSVKHVSRKVQAGIYARLLSTSQNPLLQREPAGEAPVENNAEYPTDYEVSYSEFKYVEQVLPRPTVPEVPKHESYPTPSGWFPPNDELRSQKPYLVRRTKNHMLPVYSSLKRFYYGMNHLVSVKQIEGDIWVLESELRDFLKKKTGLSIRTQVHEVYKSIYIRGEHAALVAEFLLGCGM
ncbi:unnamed protein product [Candidula unifasciata]|uniref:Large ribosomal subunit protein mL49 n=1 Tax=Candidula unifasciata TaxID=100452 RepID=A0A8S3YRJ1_9EUPU|nr:unnamed protein product [Candidula unifasciata]